MKHAFKKTVSMILAVMMIVTALPVYSLTYSYSDAGIAAQASKPEKVTDAVSKFTESMTKFSTDVSEMSVMMGSLTRFGGVASMASGVVSVLQIAGIIKDPTMEALAQI